MVNINESHPVFVKFLNNKLLTLGFNSTINMFSSSSSQPNDNLFDLEEFTPAELAEDQLKQDEMSWDQEYAVIPSNAMDSKSTEDVQSQNFTLDALWSNPESQKNFSMGQFFKNNSDDLRSMIPNQSPKKINRTNRTKGFSEQSCKYLVLDLDKYHLKSFIKIFFSFFKHITFQQTNQF